MKTINNKKAFTLIELLVVITIIGILATSAVSIYTSQIQKARDTTRINDVKALQSSIEQVYQDDWEYPDADATTFSTAVEIYMSNIPVDAKNTQPCATPTTAWTNDSTHLWYVYNSWDDANGIALWSYEISTWFENLWNVDKKASDDNWDDNARLEMWAWDLTLLRTDLVWTTVWWGIKIQ